jgi:hypothetical protein
MMGLFYLSRCWVIGRQTNELGLPPQVDFDLVSNAVGIEMRMFDQDINPRREAREVLRAAIGYAMHLGLSETQATAEVLDVYTEPNAVKSGVDVSTLNKLARKTGGTVGQEESGDQS